MISGTFRSAPPIAVPFYVGEMSLTEHLINLISGEIRKWI